jgi:altronate dehydratase small subunit
MEGQEMSQKWNALKLNQIDNVAIALRNLQPGEQLFIQENEEVIKVSGKISYGHKVATAYIPSDSKVFKYGECIGMATEDIEPGNHVHVFNIRGLKEEERATALREDQ